jgi:hypothetical protein
MKLLNGNGRETEWKREIERGTVVKTPCFALQDSKYNWERWEVKKGIISRTYRQASFRLYQRNI